MEAHIINAMARAHTEHSTAPIDRELWAYTTQAVRDMVEGLQVGPSDPPIDPPLGTPLLVAYLEERVALDNESGVDDATCIEIESYWRE